MEVGITFPIADHHTYLGVEVSKDCSWDAHIAKVIGKGNHTRDRLTP